MNRALTTILTLATLTTLAGCTRNPDPIKHRVKYSTFGCKNNNDTNLYAVETIDEDTTADIIRDPKGKIKWYNSESKLPDYLLDSSYAEPMSSKSAQAATQYLSSQSWLNYRFILGEPRVDFNIAVVNSEQASDNLRTALRHNNNDFRFEKLSPRTPQRAGPTFNLRDFDLLMIGPRPTDDDSAKYNQVRKK